MCVSVCNWTCSLWLTVTWPSLIPCPVVLLLLAAGLGITVRVKWLELQLIFRSYVQSGKCNTGQKASVACTSTVLPVCRTHRRRPLNYSRSWFVCVCVSAHAGIMTSTAAPLTGCGLPSIALLQHKVALFLHSLINTHNICALVQYALQILML